jgi:hypothetical protein
VCYTNNTNHTRKEIKVAYERVNIQFNLSNPDDRAIYEALCGQPNKTQAIKDALRALLTGAVQVPQPVARPVRKSVTQAPVLPPRQINAVDTAAVATAPASAPRQSSEPPIPQKMPKPATSSIKDPIPEGLKTVQMFDEEVAPEDEDMSGSLMSLVW